MPRPSSHQKHPQPCPTCGSSSGRDTEARALPEPVAAALRRSLNLPDDVDDAAIVHAIDELAATLTGLRLAMAAAGRRSFELELCAAHTGVGGRSLSSAETRRTAVRGALALMTDTPDHEEDL